MSWRDYIPFLTAKASTAVAGNSFLPYIAQWENAVFQDWNTRYIIEEGAKKNAAVLQCAAKLVLAYPEAPIKILREKDDEQDDSPVTRQLLNRLRNPNPFMSWEELQQITAMYLCFGGNAYWHLIRNGAGEVLEIWPKHAGVMWPHTDAKKYIDHYLHQTNGEQPQKVDPYFVAHFRWPLVHPGKPWLAMSPLEAIGKEVDSDSEMTRFRYALLKNDAVVRNVIIDRKGHMSSNATQKQYTEESFKRDHGGDNRGGTVVIQGDVEVKRLALDLKELAFDALHRVPEARIAGGFLMDVIFAGLTAGMDASTYSNRQGARQFFYEDTMTKLWRLQSGVMTRVLLPADSGLYFWHHTKDVIALRQDETARTTRIVLQFEKGLIKRNEARAALDYEPVEDEQDGFFNEVSGTSVGSPKPPDSGDEGGGGGNGEAGQGGSGNLPEDDATEAAKAILAAAVRNGNGHVKSAGGHSDPFTQRPS